MELIVIIIAIATIFTLLLLISSILYYLSIPKNIVSALHNKTWKIEGTNTIFHFKIDENNKTISINNSNTSYSLTNQNVLVAETNSEIITYTLENFNRIKIVEYNKNINSTKTGYLIKSGFF